jgi:hypothetical protein
MAAIQRTRMSSFGIGLFVVAVSAALLAGGTGGYMVRALTSQVAAPSQSHQYAPVSGDNQDVTQSDLTRALPADRSTGTASLPTWVKNYLAPAASQPFKVDQFLESLSYAAAPVSGDNQDVTQSDLTRALPADRSTGTASLPTWVKNYLAPAASQPFKVDQFLDSLSNAAQSSASAEAAAPALQFQP